jgi:ATP-dependent DNA helicase PIF1
LSKYNLPNPSVDFQNVDGVCRIVAEEINYDVEHLQTFWDQGYTRANDHQRQVLDSVTSALAIGDGGLFFLDGPGGTGKTFVESLLLAHVRAQGQVALAVASSGIASILLEGGRTSHSRFKIPIDVHSESICSISAQSDLAKLLQMATLIVWDEAPAQHRHCFEAVDRTLKDLRKSSTWFGGVTMIFAG